MEELEPLAIQTDIYLDWLLGGTIPRDARDEPTAELRRTAEVLQRSLVRFHPSFRFEERLADRLRAEATGQPRQLGSVIPFQGAAPPASSDVHADGRGRGLIVGGAIASGVSIAGALFVWRRSRTGAAPAGTEQAL